MRSTMKIWSNSEDARHRIWSLQDVFKASINDYLFIDNSLRELEKYVGNICDRETAESVIELVCKCHARLMDLGAENDITSDHYFKKCLTYLEADNYGAASSMISQIHSVVESFLSGCLIIRVDATAQDYLSREKLFGDMVYKKFPETRKDIFESGMCYAYDRYTACVLHTLRVIEVATRRITKRASIIKALANKKDKSGNSLVFSPKDGLGQKASKLHDAADYIRGKKQEKLRSAAMHIKSIASALRNPTMHTEREFTEKEAKLAMDNANMLMNDLCCV